MVRKAREDLDVHADAITPSVLRDSSIATRFPRLIKCLDGGMDPQMVGVRQYTWRDPVRRALYADKDKARGSPAVGSPSRKGGAKAGGKGRGGKASKAADHDSGAASRSVGRKKKRKAPPHPSTVTAGADDDDVHGARHLHGRGVQLGRRPLPSPVPGADGEPGEGDEAMAASWDRATAHSNRGRGRGGDSSSVGGGSVLDPALLTAVGRLTTGGSAGSTDGSSHGSGWGDDASSFASGATPVSPRSHSPVRHRGDAGSVASSSGASEASASSYSSYGSRGRRQTWRDSGGAGSAGRGAQRRTRPPVAPPTSVGRLMLAPSGPPLDAGALLPFACEGVLVNHGVLERRSAGNAAGDGGPSRRCRVVGCSGTACAVGGSSHDAAAVAAAGFLCRYHGIEPGVGSGGKTFVAQVVLPRSGATKAAYVQACGSRHAVVWKWANEFERVRDGMCAKQCLWCSGSAGFARHVPPLARVGAFEGAAGGGWSKPVTSLRRSGGGMWGSPVATNPHPLKREAHGATAAADTAPGASSGARSAHGDAKVAPAPAFGPFAPAVLGSPPTKPPVRVADVPGAPGAGRSDARREDDRGTPSHTAAWRSSAGAGDMHQPDGVARSGSGDSAVSVSGSEVSGMSASASVCADPIHVHLEVNGVVIGGLEVSGHHTLAQCREMILDELDHPPRHYLFEYKGAPVARKQEARRRAVAAHAGGGKLVLLPQPEAASPPLSVDPHRPAHARVAPGAGAAAVAAGSGIGKLPATSSAADARPAVHLPVSAQLGLGQPSPKKRQRVYEGWA